MNLQETIKAISDYPADTYFLTPADLYGIAKQYLPKSEAADKIIHWSEYWEKNKYPLSFSFEFVPGKIDVWVKDKLEYQKRTVVTIHMTNERIEKANINTKGD